MDSILKVTGLTKKYEDNYALNKVDFELKRGEIHGLVGANGSGKSTFLNILFGNSIIRETGGYSGEIIIDKENTYIKDTSSAVELGIGMVHQEFALIGDLNIASNIKINRENLNKKTEKILGKDFARVDVKRNKEDSEKALSILGIDIDPSLKVFNLSTNIKQFVEIAREIDKVNLKILMLDEPTASLNEEDSKLLLSSLKRIKEQGSSIIFISHRLEEVVEICDRITIFRDGEVVSSYSKEAFDIPKIAMDMTGKKVVKTLRKEKDIKENILLSFKDVEVNYGQRNTKGISLDIYEGEILGITGLAGHGQDIFPYGLMDVYEMSGDVRFNGEKIVPGDIEDITKKGIYILPDERKEMGLLLDSPIWKNIVFSSCHLSTEFLKIPWFKSFSPLKSNAMYEHTDNMIEDLNIKCRDKYQLVRELSGGNQQKVCLARAITTKPKLLFVGEPTRGIDLYSKELILDMLLETNIQDKVTIVVSSGELGELKRICDRIVVMYEGKVFDILKPDDSDQAFSLAILGARRVDSEK
ncbi:sugar ABC transporter ATP-binding protein [Tissierella creatinini]|nr:sugar ABC transporter ATP-binding protein [Tissierella creatinini]TJX64576.1 sugar ABC transporter ATP-binding protein [Soehngenia saccharolytica]